MLLGAVFSLQPSASKPCPHRVWLNASCTRHGRNALFTRLDVFLSTALALVVVFPLKHEGRPLFGRQIAACYLPSLGRELLSCGDSERVPDIFGGEPDAPATGEPIGNAKSSGGDDLGRRILEPIKQPVLAVAQDDGNVWRRPRDALDARLRHGLAFEGEIDDVGFRMTFDMDAGRRGPQLVGDVHRPRAPPGRIQRIAQPPARQALQTANATESREEAIAVDAARSRFYLVFVGAGERSAISIFWKSRLSQGGFFISNAADARRYVNVHASIFLCRDCLIPCLSSVAGEVIASRRAPESALAEKIWAVDVIYAVAVVSAFRDRTRFFCGADSAAGAMLASPPTPSPGM